jgi:hypothetical protein
MPKCQLHGDVEAISHLDLIGVSDNKRTVDAGWLCLHCIDEIYRMVGNWNTVLPGGTVTIVWSDISAQHMYELMRK